MEIYVTIIFHLAIAVVLMSLKLKRELHPPQMEIVLEDFSEEEAKKLELLQHEKERLEKEVNLMLRQTADQLRNTAVNEEWEKEVDSERDNVFNEHDELQQRVAATREMLGRANLQQDKGQGSDDEWQAAAPDDDKKPASEKRYTGPSVMSYHLAGRKAFVLPVPVYMCEEGGEVVVNIVVTRRGSVSTATVDEGSSAAAPCIRESARQAALLSRFSVSESSGNQRGSITYRFVPQ
ncbi:MAG: hypothetical protein LBH84_04800 [Prevotellaceae bacterium]|nr:hypothetical protein [Prevotellaceae bacterium]